MKANQTNSRQEGATNEEIAKLTLHLKPEDEATLARYSVISKGDFDTQCWAGLLLQVSCLNDSDIFEAMSSIRSHEPPENSVTIEIPKAALELIQRGADALGVKIEPFVDYLSKFLHCSPSCEFDSLEMLRETGQPDNPHPMATDFGYYAAESARFSMAIESGLMPYEKHGKRFTRFDEVFA